MRCKLDSIRVLVVGIARNVGLTLESDINIISESLGGFGSVKWLVVESDSEDSTLIVLERLGREKQGFRYLSLGCVRNSIPTRAARLAYCRNAYLIELVENQLYRNIDYVIVADLDQLNRKLTSKSIESCWDREEWDVCCANQEGPYYDIWALRHPIWCPNDWRDEQSFFMKFYHNQHLVDRSTLHYRMIRIPVDSNWIEVDSAFGGLAIYKKEALINARYSGCDENGNERCEHVSLHRKLRKLGNRIYINPKLINAGHTEHTSIGRWYRRLSKVVRKFRRYI